MGSVLWAELELRVGRAGQRVGGKSGLGVPLLSSRLAVSQCMFFDSIYFSFLLLYFSSPTAPPFLIASSLHLPFLFILPCSAFFSSHISLLLF